MEIGEQLAENRRRRRQLVLDIAALDSVLEGPDGLVAQAFAAGMTGPQIAAELNVSKPRVYQIRDGRR